MKLRFIKIYINLQFFKFFLIKYIKQKIYFYIFYYKKIGYGYYYVEQIDFEFLVYVIIFQFFKYLGLQLIVDLYQVQSQYFF